MYLKFNSKPSSTQDSANDIRSSSYSWKFAQCIFEHDFLSLRTTIVLGIQKLSKPLHVLLLWWSGTVVTTLRSLKSGIREYISPRIYASILLKNGWVNIESRKFKVITIKFLSRKFALTPIWRDLWNFEPRKFGAIRYSYHVETVRYQALHAVQHSL